LKLALIGVLLLIAGSNCDLDSCSPFQYPSQADSGARIPAKTPSQQTEPAIDNQAQKTAQKPVGFIMPPIIRGKCQLSGAAEYNPNTNTIHLCIEMTQAQERYAIAHEMGHAVDFQKDSEFEPDEEYWADQYAVNSLLQNGDCEAVESRAVSHIDIKDDYTKGILYAREMYSIHCR